MAINSSSLQETILKAIDAVVTQRNNELKLDKTISAIIKKNVGKRGNKPLYQVEYDGGVFEAIAQNADDMYSPQTGVYVLIPEGNFSKEKIIIGRASTTSTDRTTSVVAAATNSYSIVGPNLLESKDSSKNIKNIEYGLHSFHPRFRDSTHGIDHRAQFLYQAKDNANQIEFNEDRFNLYKEDTTAIMVKADFLTNLDSIQKEQPGARYGLIFNFAFDNLNKGYGETNGEIFEAISKLISANIYWHNPWEEDTEDTLEEKTLYEIYEDFFMYHLENSQKKRIEYWVNEEGILDQSINYVQGIYNTFKSNNEAIDKEIYNNSIQAFLSLLNELKSLNTTSEIGIRYSEWAAEKIGDAAQKYVQFVLSSDDMLGNPFNFNTWNSQYAVFEIDLETYNHLDSILFYKEGFKEDTEETNYEGMWPIGDGGQPDIFVRNLQIYAMNPMDNQSGDYTLKVEPYADLDIIISDHPETGYLDTTQFKATLLRKFYEDLTANGKTSYVWFKEDPNVTGSSSIGYNYLAGAGWKEIDNNTQNNYLFTTTTKDNYGYKNNYKCVVIYEPSVDDKTILSYEFSVYNQDMSLDLKLESDLGTNFSFDAGAPTITVLIDEDRNNDNIDYKEFGYKNLEEEPLYLYSWAIQDSANNYTLFLNEVFEILKEEQVAREERNIISSKEALLKKIKRYILDEETDYSERATRIKYPVSISSSGFTVTCYLQKKAKNGEYYDVGSASLEFKNKSDAIVSDYRIHIINGDQIFQYDEYGKTPCSSSKKNPLIVQPLQAKLFNPSGVEVSGTNYQVEWILPIEATMINTSETLVKNPATNLIQSYKNSELNFGISEIYDPDAYANQITCHVYFSGKHYYKDTNFYFGKQGSNGTNGTDTVAKIEYNGNDPTNILHYQPLTLYVQKEEDGTAKGMLNVGSKILRNSITFAQVEIDEATQVAKETGILKTAVYQKEKLLDPSSYAAGFPHWNLAGNTNESKILDAKFFDIVVNIEDKKTQLNWSYEINADKNYRLQNIKATVNLKEQRNKRDQYYYAFFSLPIIEYEPADLKVNALLEVNRISIDKDKYLNEIVYNQDGRNPVYNHNQGLRLYNIPSSINKIEWSVEGGKITELPSGEKIENNAWISLLEEKDDAAINAKKEIITTIENNESMVYILPDDIFDGSSTNNKIVAKLYKSKENEPDTLIATVYAPINMTLNTFGLESLNAWDGNSVTINEDDENSYVMAPQIGAGEKDVNNRFTGILMGKTETYTGGAEKEKEIGLFGYSQGLQSIFLDAETGDATFGLPDVTAPKKDEDGNISEPSHYINSNRVFEKKDNYEEGRIELRPGAESKIGGWRLGRRSIYYTMTPDPNLNIYKEVEERDEETGEVIVKSYLSEYGYKYSGEIGENYKGDKGTPLNKDYGEHHEKDIRTQDSGLLLSASPPYISIKGKKLGPDDIDNGLNSQLISGDSLEIQLDPQTPTLFTIFRHNADTRSQEIRGKRQFLAGINDKGELLANGVGKEDDNGTGTKSGNIILKAFKDTKDQESGSYVGSVFEVGVGLATTRTFFQIFREKDKPLNAHSQVYMTGGQNTTSGDLTDNSGDEYARPISIHGQNIMLYAKTGNANEFIKVKPGKGTHRKENEEYIEDSVNGDYIKAGYNWVETDANIQISTDEAQINLGESTQLFLNRSGQIVNKLKTAGAFNWDVGTSESRKNLSINAANLNENYTQILTANKGTTTVNSDGNIFLNKTSVDTNNNNITNSNITLTDNSIAMAIPRTQTGENNTVNNINNYLKINQSEAHEWTTDNQSINIKTSGITQHISLTANYIPSGMNPSQGENGSQIIIRAGQATQHYIKILMATNTSNWKGARSERGNGSAIGGIYKIDGVPFRIAVRAPSDNSEHSIEIRHNFLDGVSSADADDIGFYALRSSMEVRAPSLVLTDKVYTTGAYDNEHNNSIIDCSLWTENNIYNKGKYYGIRKNAICDGEDNSTVGSVSNVSSLGNSGSATFSAVELQNNGRPKLHKHTFSVSIPSGSTIYDAIKDSIGKQIAAALTPYALKSEIPSVDNFVKKDSAVTSIVLSGTGTTGGLSYGYNTADGTYHSGGTATIQVK